MTSMRAGICLVALGAAHAAKPYSHGWDTVADLMGMHGKYPADNPPTASALAFAAAHYSLITTGTSCSAVGANRTFTIEENVWQQARAMKASNPGAVVGMYWRTDFMMEMSDCSHASAEWAAHPEWRLRDDGGALVAHAGNHFYLDYTQPAAEAYWAAASLNSTAALLPGGTPVLDYVYFDGMSMSATPSAYAPGIGPARTRALYAAKAAMVADVQARLDARGLGQNLLLNGMDDIGSAPARVATGAAGSMFDHWTILQFLNATNGDFDAPAMDAAFDLVGAAVLQNVTTQIKGWPGPIVAQRDMYPPNIPTPRTPVELQQVGAARFNSELALFLLVATELDFWIYSWFWEFGDYVPGAADSSVGDGFYPDAKCQLGAPAGPMQRVAGSWTYTREFASASVFVDLNNRTACKVTFKGAC